MNWVIRIISFCLLLLTKIRRLFSSFHSRRTRGVKSSGRVGGKAQFLQGFSGTGFESRMGTFLCFVSLVFKLKTVWNHTGRGAKILTKKRNRLTSWWMKSSRAHAADMKCSRPHLVSPVAETSRQSPYLKLFGWHVSLNKTFASHMHHVSPHHSQSLTNEWKVSNTHHD